MQRKGESFIKVATLCKESKLRVNYFMRNTSWPPQSPVFQLEGARTLEIGFFLPSKWKKKVATPLVTIWRGKTLT